MKNHSWWTLGAAAAVALGVSCLAATTPTTPTTTTAWTDTMVAHSTASATTVSGTPMTGYGNYYTPLSFVSILGDGYTLPSSLTVSTSVVTLNRYLVSVSGSYLTIGTPSTSAATALSFSAAPTTVSGLLSKLVEAVSVSAVSGGFRLDAELHSLYSVDVDSDGTTLVFSNVRGTAASPSGRGYLVFTYDSSTHFLQAAARYTWDPATYTTTAVSSFAQQGYSVRVASGVATLVSSSSSATALTFTASPVNVAMPTQFNPQSTAYNSHAAVALTSSIVANTIADMEGSGGKVWQYLSSAYQPQVAAVGDDSSTEAAAVSMLNDIETSLTAEGASLRYPKNAYLAFRKGALQTLLKSDGIANGTLGMHAVPYAYFTNAADTSGVHHPFLCLACYSITDKPNRLVDVRRPPGDGIGANYSVQSVTRDATLQLNLVKIPLRDYGLVSALTDNTMTGTATGGSWTDLRTDAGSTATLSVYNNASTSAVGVAVDGSPIYPVLNNTLVTTQSNAEITTVGNHVGQGMGLHYHADGHIAMNNDLQLYNINDYKPVSGVARNHPPLIGFGLDGVALFGVYESLYPAMDGYSDTLDAWGGHSHGSYGYHYHAHLVTAADASPVYELDVLMKGAWRGKINAIPEFWDLAHHEPAYSLAQRNAYVGKP